MLKALHHHPLMVGTVEVLLDVACYMAIMTIMILPLSGALELLS